MRETVPAGVRGPMCFFAIVMCCISCDACFFHTPWPLIVNTPEPTIDP